MENVEDSLQSQKFNPVRTRLVLSYGPVMGIIARLRFATITFVPEMLPQTLGSVV